MPITVRSFAKINLGLHIGALRPDGFHDLRTVYQTIALHDFVSVQVSRGTGIEIRCEDPRVPKDESNTCYRIVGRAMAALKARGRVLVEIEKRLPVQGGLGGASSNAVATLLALERRLKKALATGEKLHIAAEVGSDLPLFLVGGTVLGVSRGEEVYPLPDLPPTPCVVATPEIGVSTPKAFADWDLMMASQGNPGEHDREGHAFSRAEHRANRNGALAPEVPTTEPRSARPAGGGRPHGADTMERVATPAKLTPSFPSDRMLQYGRAVSAWLSGQSQRKAEPGKALTGVPVGQGRGRAETPLLDLVRTGIENDFERVVFPQYPVLREIKGVLERGGAFYASLSGSGSATYGLFASRTAAEKAAARLRNDGIPAVATTTLTRQQYWKKIVD
jgi:4-diphosphocytidyl-2-C-methyl-D-erythritol kinase